MGAVKNRKGFTLVEVIVILAVIAILAAIAVPLALRIFQVTAEDATRTEMQNLKKAMIGDIGKLQSSVRTDFGFLGDIGRLPTGPANLDELLVKGTLPAWTFDTTKQVGAGWKGPYITGAAAGEAPEDFKKDQWGNSYTYSDADFTNADGQLADGKITSAGPDGTFGTADDIVLEILKSETTATVSGFIKDPNGNPAQSASVTINFPANGALTTSTATTDSTGRYSFSNIPFGKRSINVTPKLIVTSARATIAAFTDAGANVVCGGGVSRVTTCQYLEFTLVNFSSSAISITSLTPTYSSPVAPAPTVYYRITWSTTNVLDCDAAACVGNTGVTTTFAGQTIAAASTPLKPFTFLADSAQTQLSDIKIGAAGEVGSAVRVRLVNFRNGTTPPPLRSDRGAPVSMNGVTFTITFSDGSVVQFTPTATP